MQRFLPFLLMTLALVGACIEPSVMNTEAHFVPFYSFRSNVPNNLIMERTIERTESFTARSVIK